ncbi:MAG: hypothetical protein IJE97_11915, partial [Thermoguttaceae bacterium]|nr:hypothetical protein [Thermoguttaceae bacterium]
MKAFDKIAGDDKRFRFHWRFLLCLFGRSIPERSRDDSLVAKPVEKRVALRFRLEAPPGAPGPRYRANSVSSLPLVANVFAQL